MKMKIVPVFAAVVMLAGCASSVTRPPGSQLASGTVTTAKKSVIPLQSVTLTMTDSGKQDVSDNLTFHSDELLANVRRAMDAKGMLASNAAAGSTVEIQLTSVRIRSGFSAIMFGFMAGADNISGDVIVKSPEGRELDRFSVSASYAWGGVAGGDGTRMDWLYQQFAQETVKELAKA